MGLLYSYSQKNNWLQNIIFEIRKYKNSIKIKSTDIAFITNIRNLHLRNTSINVRGNNNSIQSNNCIFTDSFIRIEGNNNEIIFEENIIFRVGSITLLGDGHKIFIGASCRFQSLSLWLEDQNCKISIGEGTTVEGAHIAATEPGGNISIGKDCMLSFGIDIRNGDSHAIFDAETKQRINSAVPVEIKEHVWIGAHVQILKGSVIEKGSVIGTRSLVTGNIPEACIAAGIPAKPVKNKILWDRDRSKTRADNS